MKSLNAPSGAGCFLTTASSPTEPPSHSLNAPSGAGCFLTRVTWKFVPRITVLMHLLVLGAF